MIEFENNEELESYVEEHKIIEESITCDFNISLMTDLIVKGNITACDINAEDINADDIKADDIKAWNIKAWNINACDIKADDIDAGDIDACDIDACDIKADDIDAGDINASNINAGDINAGDINAYDIKADDIIYYAVCFAYNDIKCKSITGRKDNCKHFCLDGKIIIKEKEVVKDYLIKNGIKYEVKIIKDEKK